MTDRVSAARRPPWGTGSRIARIVGRYTLGLFRPIVALRYVSGAPTRLVAGGPQDASHGSVDGPNRLHLLVAGGLSGSAVGVQSHEFGVAAQLARLLAKETGRGVDWESLSHHNPRLSGTAAALRSFDGLASFDVIILSLGSADVLAFTRFRAWRAELSGLLEFLASSLSPTALVAITEVPDVSPYVQVGRLLSGGLAADAREFNAIVAGARRIIPAAQLLALPLTEPSDFEGGAFRYAALYRRWAGALSSFVVQNLRPV
ncbi:MAG: hypothetical protein V4531_05360 [Actinomycetota bacterium]